MLSSPEHPPNYPVPLPASTSVLADEDDDDYDEIDEGVEEEGLDTGRVILPPLENVVEEEDESASSESRGEDLSAGVQRMREVGEFLGRHEV